MAKKIGPSFSDEIFAAQLGGLPFSWSDDGSYSIDQLTPEQREAFLQVLAAHDSTKPARMTGHDSIKLEPRPFASLPAPQAGMLAVISDSASKLPGAAVEGGGRNTVLACSGETQWTIVACLA
jgi:hypothetical protein